jgi:small subunit ribosomal protein S1
MSDSKDFASLFSSSQQGHRHSPRPGERVRVQVVSIQGDNIYLDLGSKTEGLADAAALRDAEGRLMVAVGDSLELEVSGQDDSTGLVLLGPRHAQRLHGTAALREAFEAETPVEGHVTGVVKGGLEVEISGTRGFCPASQAGLGFIEDLQSLVGQRLTFRITKLQGGRHLDLVVSRRALLEEEQRTSAAQLRARLEPGAVLPGRVSSIKDFGAFVDLGGLDGLVHLSELASRRVRHPSEVLQVGQEVEVMVLRIDRSDHPKQPERIALSLRALAPDPWLEVPERFPVGARVGGRVTRLQPFGAFVELAPGVEGLVHISELGAGRRIAHPQEVVHVGDQVQASVLSLDLDKRRIGLSLAGAVGETAAAPEPQPKAADYDRPKQGFGTLGDLLRETMERQKPKR